jgi:hypothetical protein
MKRLFTALALGLIATMMVGGIASAGAPANTPGKVKDLYIWYYTVVEETGSPASEDGVIKNLGGAISGGFYGNTANSGVGSDAPDSGHGVTAPSSPAPLVGGCNSGPGASLGFFITGNGPAAVPANPDAGPSC